MNTLINTNTALKIFEGHDVTAVTTVGHPVVHCYRTWYEIAPTVGVDSITSTKYREEVEAGVTAY